MDVCYEEERRKQDLGCKKVDGTCKILTGISYTGLKRTGFVQ